MSVDNNSIPYDLISKHLCHETTAEEDEVLFKWLDVNQSHLVVFEELIALYAGSEVIVTPEAMKESWQLIRRRGARRRQISMGIVWMAAASLVFFALVSVYLYVSGRETTVRTVAGERKYVMLPDSSRVWLNGLTVISFDKKSFVNNRRVVIEGEAFFEIKELSSPFVIAYDSVLLSASGGEVNVEAYGNRREKKVTVSDGSMWFEDLRKSSFRMEANAGDEVTSVTGYGLLSRETSNNVNVQSWMTDQYAFSNASVEEIVELVSKGRDLAITPFDDSVRYKTISGVFEFDAARDTGLEFVQRLLGTATYQR